MKSINKATLLKKLSAGLENQLAEVNILYRDEDSEVLLEPADDGGWSIAQCVEHLNTYSAWYNMQIGKALDHQKRTGAALTFTSGWLGNYLTNMMSKDSEQKKYKAMPKHLPAEYLNAREVIETFIANQRALLLYIRRAANADLENTKVPTTISKLIKLRLGDVLLFTLAHQERHLTQARKNHKKQRSGVALNR